MGRIQLGGVEGRHGCVMGRCQLGGVEGAGTDEVGVGLSVSRHTCEHVVLCPSITK